MMISTMHSSASLNFLSLTFVAFDSDYCRISRQRKKFFENRKYASELGQKHFSIWRPSAILNLKVWSFITRFRLLF